VKRKRKKRATYDDDGGEKKNTENICVDVYFCGETAAVIFNDQFISNISYLLAQEKCLIVLTLTQKK
jgi:hypothetical protein